MRPTLRCSSRAPGRGPGELAVFAADGPVAVALAHLRALATVLGVSDAAAQIVAIVTCPGRLGGKRLRRSRPRPGRDELAAGASSSSAGRGPVHAPWSAHSLAPSATESKKGVDGAALELVRAGGGAAGSAFPALFECAPSPGILFGPSPETGRPGARWWRSKQTARAGVGSKLSSSGGSTPGVGPGVRNGGFGQTLGRPRLWARAGFPPHALRASAIAGVEVLPDGGPPAEERSMLRWVGAVPPPPTLRAHRRRGHPVGQRRRRRSCNSPAASPMVSVAGAATNATSGGRCSAQLLSRLSLHIYTTLLN